MLLSAIVHYLINEDISSFLDILARSEKFLVLIEHALTWMSLNDDKYESNMVIKH